MASASAVRAVPQGAVARPGEEYREVLDASGLITLERGPWLVVGRSPLVQGWKLHISSRCREAVHLLKVVVPYLAREGVSFKCARSPLVLGQLNEGGLGGTQIGKFITVYPESDDRARTLATALIDLTQRFEGPAVTTDLKLGKVVYARYGGHNPIIIRDRLGNITPAIQTPDGGVRPDVYSVPFRLHDGISNPFEGMVSLRVDTLDIVDAAGERIVPKSSKLFGPGYLILEVLKEHAKGSVFLGIDLRSQDSVAPVVLKQGRRHCLSDEFGRDMRCRLRRQQMLHRLLHGRVPVPSAGEYFEVNGDGYLPLEYIEGKSIETVVSEILKRRPWADAPPADRRRVLSYLEKLLCAIGVLHEAGYVHRDLTASNVWVSGDGKVHLLDLELAHALDDLGPTFGLGTPGFMSLQQEQRERPAATDDIYSLGCVFILALTGTDPRRILFGGESRRVDQLGELTGGAPEKLLRVTARAVLADPMARPSLLEMKDALAMEGPKRECKRPRRTEYPMAIRRGIQGMLGGVPRDASSGAWLSPSLRNSTHLRAGEPSSGLELRRGANRGVAGVVYVLSRAAGLGYDTPELRQSVEAAVDWLLRRHATADSGLPGLHFGEAGTALAVAEAAAAGVVPISGAIRSFLCEGLDRPLDWPDLTHGAAGQGIAAFCCSDLLGDRGLLKPAHACAKYLMSTQQANGSWIMPPGVDGMSGQTLTGFAHGVAGIVYFLAEYDRRCDSAAARRSWQSGVEWLERKAVPSGSTLHWEYSDAQPLRWQWWCHGGPGIALTFLRLYEQTNAARFAEVARSALRAHPRRLRYANLTQCHGLSGLGDIYLEASRVLGDRYWAERASEVADVLLSLARDTDPEMLIWLTEDPLFASADLMVGTGGIVHFLLRLEHPDGGLGFPLLPRSMWP